MCFIMVAIFVFILCAQVAWLDLSAAVHPALSLHLSSESDELSQWLWS